MQIQLNGQKRDIASGLSLDALLDTLNVNKFTVVVERNESVIKRAELPSTLVEEGDIIEIVRIIGGGSDEGSSNETAATNGEASSQAVAPAKKKAKKKAKKTKKKKAAKKSRKKGPSKLVIVESPAKAKTINKYLGPDFQVEASMGHVRDLPKSKMGVDVENNFSPNYIIVSKSRKTVTHLKKQAKGKSEIYLAPDPDREGEAISWHLAHIFGEVNADADIKRVVFNEITKDAVKSAFDHPRTIKQNLVDAQQARRILDRVVGYELSPLLWKKVGRGLSAGRVQSVALRLIVDREREIRKFVPQEYWTLEAKLLKESDADTSLSFLSKLEKIEGKKVELKNKEETKRVRDEILKESFKVAKVEKRQRRRRPSAPYTTSKLQQEAYNKLGFPAAKTMRIAQALYEGVEIEGEGSVGLITYMRTDSVNISKTAQEEAMDFIKGKYGPDYLPEKPPVYKSKKGAQEAHEAIRPTSVKRNLKLIQNILSDDEFKLYELIWRKFVGSQMKPALDEHVVVSIQAGPKYLFKTTGRRNLFPGFSILDTPLKEKEAASDDTDESDKTAKGDKETVQDLPHLTEGEMLKLHELIGYQHFTKPPGRFNDASLVKLLEENGIGRPSTYAPTIFTLLQREYVNRKGGALVPTELGEMVTDMLLEHFERILDTQFTANMEEELDRIEDGQLDWVRVIQDFYGPFSEHLKVAREKMENVRREAIPTDHVCDVCSKPMVIKWGRFGKFLACSGFPDCKYTRSIPTGYVCPKPNCGGDIVQRKSAKRRTFYGCSKYPNCDYISNKLPKKEDDEDTSSEEKTQETARETIGP